MDGLSVFEVSERRKEGKEAARSTKVRRWSPQTIPERKQMRKQTRPGVPELCSQGDCSGHTERKKEQEKESCRRKRDGERSY